MKNLIFLILISVVMSQAGTPDQSISENSLTQTSGCPPGCLTCTNSASCDLCQPNSQYWPSANACLSCLTFGCLQCVSITNCILCEYPMIYLFGICVPSQGINPTCTYCNQSLSNFLNWYCYCQNCTIGYFNSGGECLPCIANCVNCSSTSNCLQCSVGYVLNTQQNQCLACPNADFCPEQCAPGLFYYTASGTCLPCLPFCLECSNNSTCSSCASGYYLTQAQFCNPCYPGCTSCTNITQCFSCGASTQLFQTNSSFIICRQCPNNCQQCQIINLHLLCTQCEVGYYLQYQNNKNYTICISCPDGCAICLPGACSLNILGYYISSGESIACSYSCINCTSSTQCNSCDVSTYLLNGMCMNCLQNCISCTNSTTCVGCNQNYFVNETGGCSICPQNCISCYNSTTCQQCYSTFFVNTIGGCSACPANCELCYNSTACYQCNNVNYYLNISLQCSECPFGCTSCTNSTICTSCLTSFYLYLDNYTCPQCKLAWVCTVCVANTLCYDGCISGNYMNYSNFNCQSCISGCINCTSANNCYQCYPGSIFNNGACIHNSPILITISVISGIFLIIMVIQNVFYLKNKIKQQQQQAERLQMDKLIHADKNILDKNHQQ